MKPQTIQIFLPEGAPTSVKEAELTNRLIKTIWFPRTAMDKAAKRDIIYNKTFINSTSGNFMKKIHSTLLIILALALTFNVSNARTVKLTEAKPIKISKSLELKTIENAIIGALIQNDWVTEPKYINTEKNEIVGAYYKVFKNYDGPKKIMVTIKYSTEKISFKYFDSERMKYKPGKKGSKIHFDYGMWSKALAKQIKKNIKKGAKFDFNQLIQEKGINYNPRLSEPLSEYKAFTLEPTVIEKIYQDNKGNMKALEDLNQNLNLELEPILKQWNNNETGKTLLIQPKIKAVRFIGAGLRFFTSHFSGSSWILVELNLVDSESGKTITSPLLFHEGGKGSVSDKSIAKNMALDIKDYLVSNYENPVGGGRYPYPSLLEEILRTHKAKQD